MAYVYRHIRLDKNEPFYIGISKRDSPNYERAYNSYKYHRNKHWLNIISKTDYEVEILFDNITYEVAKEKEIEFIELYKRKCDGGTLANLTKGGDGVLGFKNPKLAERNKAGIWKGRHHTAERNARMSQIMKGREMSNEWKSRISETRKRMGLSAGIKNIKYNGPYGVYVWDELIGVYPMITDVAAAIGFPFSAVSKVVRGVSQNIGGFVIKRMPK